MKLQGTATQAFYPVKTSMRLNVRLQTKDDYFPILRREMDDIHDRVRHNIERASDTMKDQYDVVDHEETFQVDELVLIHSPQRRRNISPKLHCSLESPYQVVKLFIA